VQWPLKELGDIKRVDLMQALSYAGLILWQSKDEHYFYTAAICTEIEIFG